MHSCEFMREVSRQWQIHLSPRQMEDCFSDATKATYWSTSKSRSQRGSTSGTTLHTRSSLMSYCATLATRCSSCPRMVPSPASRRVTMTYVRSARLARWEEEEKTMSYASSRATPMKRTDTPIYSVLDARRKWKTMNFNAATSSVCLAKPLSAEIAIRDPPHNERRITNYS